MAGYALLLTLFFGVAVCCDLEVLFSDKQVSLEENTGKASVVFRGLMIATVPTFVDDLTVRFELINTYKGAATLDRRLSNNFDRRINVTFAANPKAECLAAEGIPREYIIFCEPDGQDLRAISIARWDEDTDQRVWAALGWTKWTDWSACSVPCSSGIQQRVRTCRLAECPGYNVEQRHCNLFGCDYAVNPLTLEEGRVFHPSKDNWKRVPDRPSAWRLSPDSYLWVPSSQLFKDNKDRPFPKEFALFVTLRILNNTMGMVFSLRSRIADTYLSLEVAGSDLKLVHATANGTDVVTIPATLDDGLWHQISLSIRDNTVVDSYVDCEWSRTDILKRDTLDIPGDADLIIGYLFSGDLEQLTIVPDPAVVGLQCDTQRTPIIDPSVNYSSTEGAKASG